MALRPVLLDTGAIIALLDRRERQHAACVDAIASVVSALVTCEAVIAEACYLMRSLPGAADAVLANVAEGVFQIPFQLSRSARPVREIMKKYRDRNADFADACLVHLANELRTGEILTLDGDFRIYRWGANKPFNFRIPVE